MSTSESTAASSTSLPPEAILSQLIFGKWVSMAISVAAKLRIADHLASSSKTVDELAALASAHPKSLFRLLRALASVGVFASDSEGRFHLTSMGQLLRTGVKGSMRGIADYCGASWSWRAWEAFEHSVRTGETAFNHMFGEYVFEYLAKHPHESEVFNEGMTGFSGMESESVADSYAFPASSTIVDVGGGHGHLLATLLSRNPGTSGILFDSPHVVAGAGDLLMGFGVAERCQVTGGSFFESIPTGGDYYMMKHIIHDWDDDHCARILKNIRKACKEGTKLLIIELVIPPGDAPHPGKLLDLEMLCVASGQERTEQEYSDLLQQGGFTFQRVVSTNSPTGIVESVAF